MLYTIGNTKSYNQYFDDYGPDFKKKGRDDNYSGGSVFLTLDEAKHAIKNTPEYSVWGLDTTIENVYENNGNLFIIDSCRILKLFL